MKHKHFYTHLVQINDITLDLGSLDMNQDERLHLLSLLDANIHATVMHTVLSELSLAEKKVFLSNLIINDHDKTWAHLRKRTNGLEQKIKDSVNKLVLEMRSDIKKVRNSK